MFWRVLRRQAEGPCGRAFLSAAALPPSADVVVVGGGSLGASVLYHLRKRGLAAILLEKDQITSGTTWHSAGMLWRLRPADADIELHTYTRDTLKQLEVEQDAIGSAWHENGGLFIANNSERMREYERLAETGKFFGIASHVLAPEEIHDVHPLVATDDVYAALHCPTDGTIDPTGAVTLFARASRQIGPSPGRACIFEHEAVTDITTESIATSVASVSGATTGTTTPAEITKRVTSVTTASGHTIVTPWVVNCAGAWSNALACMVGAHLPLLAMKHAMVITEGIPGMHGGLPNVRDHDLSVYLKTQGNAMAIGGYEQNPEFWHDVDPNFHFGLFDLDWDTFGQNLEGHMTRCPAIADTGIKSTVCGPESFTPDHKPLVGPQPGVRGFFNACGFNSMGMMLGGGIGREIAAWIEQGAPDVDIFSFDCARYHPDTVRNSKWVFDRTHESYAKTYSIVFPHDEALAGRGFRKSALHAELEQRGCVHQARHGFERPGWFDPASKSSEAGVAPQSPKPYDFYGAYATGAWRLAPSHPDVPAHNNHRYKDLIEGELTFDWPASHALVAEECRAAREGVALFDQSYFGKFFLQGPRADEAVQWICGADMRDKEWGSVTYTPLCNAQGGVEADLTVTKLKEWDHVSSSYYFAAGGNTMTKDFEWIAARLEEKGFTNFDVTLRDASSDFSILSLQGPHVRELMQPLMGDNVDLCDDEAFPFSTCQENSITIAGHPVAMCLRLTFVGELGYELHIANEHAVNVYRALREAGEAYEREKGVPVRDAGYRAIDSLSAEKNYRHWHADLSNRDTPMEAGIGFTVLGKLKQEIESSSTVGEGDIGVDFLGRQALEAHRARGLQRRLVCLVLNDATRPLHGLETIWRDGCIVGYVRSTAFGHTLGKTITYGYVDKPPESKLTNKWLKAGDWEIGDCGERLAAELHLKAPFDPMNLRVKGEYE